MMSQDHRVEKLETAAYAGLTPAGRIREVLKAIADGNCALAQRIGEMCPVYTYRMSDYDYRLQSEGGLAVLLHADAIFEKYAFGYRILKGLKDMLVPKVAGIIAYDASTRTMNAMLDIMIKGGAGDVELDPPRLEEAEEKAKADASDTLAKLLDVWHEFICNDVRAEWAGFDAFCQSQFHFDGWTFVKGWNVKPDSVGVWIWVQHVLSEPPPENQSEKTQKRLKDLAVESEAMCRAVFLARLGKSGAASST
jgi:hypothetical protein